MAIADITARLYSLQSFRSASLSKIAVESFRQNIAYRFTVMGMLGTLVRSKTLLDIAEGRYAAKVDVRLEKRKLSEEESFKAYTTASIKTLGNQITLLTAATEKNTAIINMLANDLGYFRGQRRINYLTATNLPKSFRVPMASKTVKGQIDLINEEIQKIRSMGFVGEIGKDPRIAKSKARRELEKEQQKNVIAAALGASMGVLGALTGGVGGAALAGMGALSLGAGAFGVTATQKAIEMAVRKSIPLLGTAFKATLAIDILSGVASRTKTRMGGGTGLQLGSSESYVNNEVPGTAAYRQRELEIAALNEGNKLLEQPISLLDKALVGYSLYWLVTRGAKGYQALKSPAAKRLLGRVKNFPGARKILPTSVPTATVIPTAPVTSAAAAMKSGSINEFAGLNKRQLTSGDTGRKVAAALGVSVQQLKSMSTRDIRSGLRYSNTASVGAAAAPAAKGTPLGAAPASTRVKRRLPKGAIKALGKLNALIKNKKIAGFAKVGGISLALTSVSIIDMIEAANQYENRQISPEEYKQRTVRGYKTLVDIIGVTGVSAAIGTVIGGPIGFFAGVGGGIAASYFMEDATTSVAETLFKFIHSGVMPTMPDTSIPQMSAAQTTEVASRTQAPTEVSKVVSEDAAFMNEVNRVSDKFGIDPADLLAVMYRESQLDPQMVNSKSGATGLIQFIPDTAKGLGTTTTALAMMSRAEQMKYVEKYFDNMGLPRGADRGTIYSYVFLPKYAKQGKSFLAAADDPETAIYYKANMGLDVLPPFGVITTDDLTAATSKDGPMLARLAKQQRSMVASLPGDTFRESTAEVLRVLAETLPEPAKRAMGPVSQIDLNDPLVSKINEIDRRISVTESALEISTQRLAGQLYNQGKSQLETKRILGAKSDSTVSTENRSVDEYYA